MSRIWHTRTVFWFKYNLKGLVYEKGKYKNGKKEGMFFDFYQTGQLNWQENYKDGKVDGLSIIYHENRIIHVLYDIFHT